MTWPGYVGVLTGLAPGRFAIAINQPPLPGWSRAVGWPMARLGVARSTAIQPSHLLRLAFDSCAGFDDAVALVRHTSLCIPAIFILAGPRPGEAVVIERTRDEAFHPTDPVAANHWASHPSPRGRPRNPSSPGRHAAMCHLRQVPPGWSLDWVAPPMLKPDTRLALVANPANGHLLLQGWEVTGPATSVLHL